jgi:hypothetical protein
MAAVPRPNPPFRVDARPRRRELTVRMNTMLGWYPSGGFGTGGGEGGSVVGGPGTGGTGGRPGLRPAVWLHAVPGDPGQKASLRK